MKKRNFFVKIASLITVGMLVLPVSGFGQTVNNVDTINQLLKQIQGLQAKLVDLQRQQRELQQQTHQTVAELVKALREGSEGDDVKVLQTLLSADPDIYPEGLITGYYGRLTASAVKKFQKKHGLEQAGIVGPKTLKKLNEFLEDHPIAFERATSTKERKERDDDEDEDDDKRPCAIVPPGHLIAPGWLKKHDGKRPIVPECQKLPPGIWKKLPDTGTTTPPVPPADTVAPIISNIVSSAISSTSATVAWTTNESATSKVYYGMTTPLDLGGATSVSNASLVTSHSLTLSSLMASSTYYYVVESKDAANNMATSSQQTFITLVN